uniref:Uncharacterized protein n=1 Tax=Chenopodium quinoa TaxID=63459 RepID=A0A803MJL6_CHEQI
MFQYNKASRATHLEEELAVLDFEKSSFIDGYCDHIKSLADRLLDVDAPILDSKLVLKLTAGLPEAYAGRNRLAKEGRSGNRNQAALVTSTGTDINFVSSSSSRSSSKGGKSKKSNSSKGYGKSRNNSGQQAQQPSGFGLVPFNWKQSLAAWAPWLAQWLNLPPCL